MPTLTDPAVLTLARHYRRLGGWMHVSYFVRESDRAANQVLLDAGHLTEGRRGRSATYELTPAGYAWLAEQGS